MPQTLEKHFRTLYPWAEQSDIHTSYAPYRVCPLGAHIDHQYGIITGFALDKGVTLRFLISTDGAVNLDSMNFPDHVSFDLGNIGEKQGNWGDYAKGAAFALSQKYELKVGLKGVIRGTLPVGGLSSSAAVVLCYINALCYANKIQLSAAELIKTALFAENAYVGINVGKLDQSCEVLCKKQHLLTLDTTDDSYTLIPAAQHMKQFEIAIFYSGVSRVLGSGYNTRVDEAKSAAYSLKALSGMEYGLYKDTRLRDVPVRVYEGYRDKLPLVFAKRAQHYYTEMDRVEKGIEAWKKGDLETFGNLVFASGYSSIHAWETGSPELRAIYEISEHIPGVYGCRFSGAGFKGCCMALIDPAYKEAIEEQVTREYLQQFPQYKDQFSVHFCKTDDGVRVE
jgi:galactokinase/galacturonokinase